MIISISQNFVVKNFHHSLSNSSTQFLERLMNHHRNRNMITATSQRYLSSQTQKSFHHYLFTVHWDHLLIQLNKICAYEKTISQPNSHNSVTNRKWNTNTEIPMKSNKIGPTHNISEVSSKVYLSNVGKVLCKGILKPCPIATCNVIRKAAEFHG